MEVPHLGQPASLLVDLTGHPAALDLQTHPGPRRQYAVRSERHQKQARHRCRGPHRQSEVPARLLVGAGGDHMVALRLHAEHVRVLLAAQPAISKTWCQRAAIENGHSTRAEGNALTDGIRAGWRQRAARLKRPQRWNSGTTGRLARAPVGLVDPDRAGVSRLDVHHLRV